LTAAKGLTLQCHVAQELNGRYISDPLRLRQIVNNLLSNAVKFTPKGEIALTAKYDSPKLTIAISDTGKGMATEFFRNLPVYPVHKEKKASAWDCLL
jgi:signal transduction histidine kinase